MGNPQAGVRSTGARSPLSGAQRLVLLGGVAAALAAGAAIASLATTGELVPAVLLDPGAATRYGLPIARAVHSVLAAMTIGVGVFACFVLPGNSERTGVVGFHQWRAGSWASISASCWIAATLAVIVFSASSATGIPVADPGFGAQLVFYALSLERGNAQVLSLVLVAVSALLFLAPRSVNRLGWAAASSVLALLPLAITGHAAGADAHGNAVNSLGMHLIGVAIWVGGLMALIALAPRVPESLGTVVARYSRLALAGFTLTVLSGILNSWLRLDAVTDLFTHPYGRLLLVKIVLTTVFGVLGWVYRSRLIPGLKDRMRRRRTFLRLIVVESLLMAVVFGLSAGLSASAPPVSQDPITYDARHALLGYPFPPPMSTVNVLTMIQVDWIAVFLVVVAAGAYLAGVRKLRRAGVTWPVARTAAWIAGCASLLYFTSGGPAVYGKVSFSAHMIQHMGLMMYTPLLLVLGSPVLLALRALDARRDGSRGLREWLLVLLHSRYSRFLTRPAVAALIFAGSLVAFYFTGWFEWALSDHTGHVVMMAHFLASGYLFFWVILGTDPGPARPPHLIRLLILLVTMAFHAFFGVAIMSASTVLAASWWSILGLSDEALLLADQSLGGAIAWGAGEVPVVIAALIVTYQWVRSDERTARRQDRQADRDQDRELKAYNERLQRLDHQSRQGPQG